MILQSASLQGPFVCMRYQDTGFLTPWMASSEVDMKALGKFASGINSDDPVLSAMLYRVLGLSVMLSTNLLHARGLHRLDPVRETKSLQLYHHILWLSREGLLILEEYVLPAVERYVELKVLVHKSRASFYHLFALFHNEPPVYSSSGVETGHVQHVQRNIDRRGALLKKQGSRPSLKYQLPPQPQPQPTAPPPPGFEPVRPLKSASSFLLPALDYTPTATACFNQSVTLANKLLPGSNPVRLSVKLEYAAYLHDCLDDIDGSRRVAKQAIADVYNAQEGMDDSSFADAAEIVGILGKMIRRGGAGSDVGGQSSYSPPPPPPPSEMARISTPTTQQQQQQVPGIPI